MRARTIGSRVHYSSSKVFQSKVPDVDVVREDTVKWINNFVVKLNLCPFAKNTIEKGGLKVEVFEGSSVEDLKDCIVDAASVLSECTEESQTVVFAAPFVEELESFEAYLEVAADIEEEISWAGLEGEVQLATFHPRYYFADASPDDVTNFTNRSPWPLFHLLRESEVTRGVKSYGGNTEVIWERNKATMRASDRTHLEELTRARRIAGELDVAR